MELVELTFHIPRAPKPALFRKKVMVHIKFTKKRKCKLKSINLIPSDIPVFSFGTGIDEKNKKYSNDMTGLYELEIDMYEDKDVRKLPNGKTCAKDNPDFFYIY